MPIYLAWAILFYTTFSNGLVPAWVLSIPAGEYMRVAWRSSILAFILISFVMHEHRTCNAEIRKMYKISYFLSAENKKKIYVSSFA